MEGKKIINIEWKGEKIIKKESGITLIALIITIIILVILAAVSIRAAYNSGIIDYSINGVQRYEEAAKDEESKLKNAEEYLASVLNKANKKEEEIENEIEESYSVVLHEDYLTGYTLIEVKVSNSETKYEYDGNPMYYVEKDINNNYGAYCWIIEGTTTTDDANSKITETDIVEGTIDKSTFLGRYDIEVNGRINSNDIMKVAKFVVGFLSPLEDMSAALKADCNSDYCVDTTDIDECDLGNLITITPNTTEISEQVIGTITYTNYLSLQQATKKVGFGATLAEATSNAENSIEINGLTTNLTATSDGYFYAFVEDSTGQRIEKNYQITNVIDTTIDYVIEIINDYAVSGDSSYKLLIIYTNNVNSAFKYDNITFYDITNSNYTYNGASYSKIFALPFYGTDTINNNLIYKKNRSSITVNELLYNYDVNMSGVIDINDAQCCYNTSTIYWTLDNEQYRGIVLNSDANKDKHVDGTDQSLVMNNLS